MPMRSHAVFPEGAKQQLIERYSLPRHYRERVRRCGGGGSTPPVPTPTPGGKIQHVIIVFQENRSPDNLFRGLPNADTNPAYGLNSQGGEVTLQPIDLEVAFDLGHSHPEFLTEWDNGKLDGWNNEPVTQCNRLQCPPGPQRPYEYVPEAQVQQYWDLAQQYVFGDKFIEQQLGLGSLGYTDALANDLSDCFDFTQTPRKYQQIQSKYSRSFFLRMPNDTRPIEDE
jgi:phospholipase C